ncbi:ribosomal L7Ae/L30e/S12e/Gadd45 family protein [Pediococcus argentinicus]|uniref:L7Ae/L30e/S12e/Gadd45 family ribosomal protein n=1 Tax=Pediococcus argentinicus TaxID=480391 RepID=UPI00338E67A8
MANNSVLQLLGLVRRSGNLITGEGMILAAVRNKSAKLVLVTSDMGPSSFKKITDKCKFYEIPFYEVGTKAELSDAIGQMRSAVAISDKGFAKSIIKKFEK